MSFSLAPDITRMHFIVSYPSIGFSGQIESNWGEGAKMTTYDLRKIEPDFNGRVSLHRLPTGQSCLNIPREHWNSVRYHRAALFLFLFALSPTHKMDNHKTVSIFVCLKTQFQLKGWTTFKEWALYICNKSNIKNYWNLLMKFSLFNSQVITIHLRKVVNPTYKTRKLDILRPYK